MSHSSIDPVPATPSAVLSPPAYRLHVAQKAPASLQVAVLGAAPLVEVGLRTVLGERGHELRSVADAAGVLDETDAVVIDVSTLGQWACVEVGALVAGGVGPVLCLGTGSDPDEWRRLRDAGAHGYLAMTLTPADLVASLEQLATGGPSPVDDAPTAAAARTAALDRVGCTEREGEILTLIAHGLSNKEISAELFLGVNTIKTYIRSAYRKIGVATRSHAVIWGIEHGL